MRTVLVVDDEPFVRVTLATLKLWSEHGYDFRYEASNGAQALELIREHPEIDIVLLDVSMPVMDGIGFLEALPGTAGDRSPAVIILSAHDDFPLVRRAFTLGARDYLLKSEVDGDALVALLDKLDVKRTSGNKAEEEPPLEFPVTVWGVWISDFETVQARYGAGLERFERLFLRTIRQVCDRRGGGKVQSVPPNAAAVYTGPGPQNALFADDLKGSLERYLSVRVEVRSSAPADTEEGLADAWRALAAGRPATSRIVLQTLRYLRAHFTTPVIPLEDLAAHVGVSKNHLSYEFTRETGETITDHLARLRVEEACRYLATTTLKVYEIAEKVGYTSIEHFFRVFKKVTGTSPARWLSETETSVFRDIDQ